MFHLFSVSILFFLLKIHIFLRFIIEQMAIQGDTKYLNQIENQDYIQNFFETFTGVIQNITGNHNQKLLFNPYIKIQNNCILTSSPAILVTQQEFERKKLSLQQNILKQNQSQSRIIQKSLMCSDLLNKPQLLKYSKQIITTLININSNSSQKYPKHVLKYYNLFYRQSQSVLIISCQNYSEYKPASYFIKKAAVNNKKNKNLQNNYLKYLATSQEQQKKLPQFSSTLTQTQILTIALKILKGFLQIREIQDQINMKKIQENRSNLMNQQGEQKYQSYCNLLKYFNPETDILINPLDLDVKLYNFGFKEDLDICSYQYKMEATDSNFVYRHPNNLQFQISKDSKTKYNQKYIKQGLQQSDILWLTAMIIYRLSTGKFPFKGKEGFLKRIPRGDFDCIKQQMITFLKNGFILNNQNDDKQNICQQLANFMVRFSNIKGELFYNELLKDWISYIEQIALNQLPLKHLKNILQKKQQLQNQINQKKEIAKWQKKQRKIAKIEKNRKLKNKSLIKNNKFNKKMVKDTNFILLDFLQEIKSKMKLEIQPLNDIIKYINVIIQSKYWILKDFKDQMIQQQQQGQNDKKKYDNFMELAEILLKVLLQLRRRSKNLCNQFNQKRETALRTENLQQQSHPHYKLFQQYSQSAFLQKCLKKFLIKLNSRIINCCQFFIQIFQQNNQKQHPIYKLSKFYYNLFHDTKQIQNTQHKKQIIQKILDIEQDLDQIVKQQMRYCKNSLQDRQKFSYSQDDRQTKYISEVHEKIVDIFSFDEFIFKVSLNCSNKVKIQLYQIYTYIKHSGKIYKLIVHADQSNDSSNMNESIQQNQDSNQSIKRNHLQKQFKMLSLCPHGQNILDQLCKQQSTGLKQNILKMIKSLIQKTTKRKKDFIMRKNKKVILI